MADYDKLLQVPRGTKARLEEIKLELLANTIVYATDTNELGIKLSNGNIEYFMNATDINARIGIANINYADLVSLRNSNTLKKGALYRIIDYETTTVQVETRSAGHLFDIIVQALDEKTLSENAFAINSSRDTAGYFNGMRLGAWKLKYTLDNDRFKYYWADPVNGKGVIYRMIDEYENDLPYDFKNIQFKRYFIETYTNNADIEGKYYGYKDTYVYPSNAVVDEDDFIWAYTFTTKVASDESYIETTTLNKYMGINDEGNAPYCAKNVFSDKSMHLHDYDLINKNNSYVLLGNNVIYSEIDSIDEENPMYLYLPHSNTIKNDFYLNTIGDGFRYNAIGNGFYNNTVGDGFQYNTIGSGFHINRIRSGFESNTVGNAFKVNSVGYSFGSNTIGNGFEFNSIGDNFVSNAVGNSFNYNKIGNYFCDNNVGNSIENIQFSLDGTAESQIRYLHLKDGLRGISHSFQLDLYYVGLYNREYHTTFELIANGNVISFWETTPLTSAVKVKATNGTTTWSATLEIGSGSSGDGVDLNTLGYMGYAADIFYRGRRHDLFHNAWNNHNEITTLFDGNISFEVADDSLGYSLSFYSGDGIDELYDFLANGGARPEEALKITVDNIVYDASSIDSRTNTGLALRYDGDLSDRLELPTSVYTVADEGTNPFLPFLMVVDTTDLGLPLGKAIGFISNENVTHLKIESGFNHYYENGIIIPDGIEVIPNFSYSGVGDYGAEAYLFYNDLPLVIPNSVTTIWGAAFASWHENNQPLVIPNRVTDIGALAFGGWVSNNQPLIISSSVTTIGYSAFGEWQSNNHPLTIPSSLTIIEERAFSNWASNNQPLTILNGAKTIGENAFYGWTSNKQQLIIPNSVTSIGSYAFMQWTSNNQPLIIPDSVTSIGYMAFYGWSLVPYIEIHATTPPTLVNANAFSNQNNAPIYVPNDSLDDYKTATNWVELAYRIFPIGDVNVIGDIKSALNAILGV